MYKVITINLEPLYKEKPSKEKIKTLIKYLEDNKFQYSVNDMENGEIVG